MSKPRADSFLYEVEEMVGGYDPRIRDAVIDPWTFGAVGSTFQWEGLHGK